MIFRNLFKRKVRSTLTIVGIGIGVAAVVILGAIADGFAKQFTSLLTKGGADLTVRQADVADMSLSAISDDVGKRLATMAGVESVSGMIYTVVPAKGAPYFIIMGLDPNEYAIRHFRIIEGTKLSRNKEIIIGKMAAENLKQGVGDTLRVQQNAYKIVGIYETGIGFEDAGAVLPLSETQSLLKKPRQVNLYQIKLKDPDKSDEVIKEIRRRFTDITVDRSADFIENTQDIQVTRSTAWTISLIAVAIGGIGMMNTMLMSVFERTREIGVLRALGWRRRRIMLMILQESLALSFLGGATGILLGIGVVGLLGQFQATAGLLEGAFSARLFIQAMMVALTLGALGGLYPAYRAANASPLEALRYE